MTPAGHIVPRPPAHGSPPPYWPVSPPPRRFSPPFTNRISAMAALFRRSVAEALGTYALIFFGCGAVVMGSLPGAGFGLLGVALVHAIVLGVMITATMHVSGGHLNPAVTIGLWSVKR